MPRATRSEKAKGKQVVRETTTDESNALFKSTQAENLYKHHLQGLDPIFGKSLDLSFMDTFFPHILGLFTAIGWAPYVTYQSKGVFPQLTRLFYANLERTSQDTYIHFETYLFGKTYKFSDKTVADLFGMGRGDFRCPHLFSTSWILQQDFQPEDFLPLVMSTPPTNFAMAPSYSSFTLEAKILHLIISYNILPKSGSRNHVSFLDCFVMWCILKEKRLDLPNLICQWMTSRERTKRYTLPFGGFLTPLFESFGFSRDPSNFIPRKGSDMFNVTTLKLMGFSYQNGAWVPKGHRPPPSQRVEEQEEEQAAYEQAENPSSPDTAPVTRSFMKRLVKKFAKSVEKKISKKLDKFNSRLTKIEEVLHVPSHPSEDEEDDSNGDDDEDNDE